jgi:hypothetical protein
LIAVVAIIAVLVALLFPALAKARFAARCSVCLSNQRQLAVSWTAYTNDYKVFPFGDPATYRPRYDWGGVNWYASGTVPGLNLTADRPLNPYVDSAQTIEFRAAVFKCPLDIGAHDYVSGVRDWEQLGPTSRSGEPNTCFGIAGTSYLANYWIYCAPGVTTGWQNSQDVRRNLGPEHVQISPSRFVLLMDIGPANLMVSEEPYRQLHDLWGEWWHGREQSPMTFLDGSVRVEKSGLRVCDRYSFHLLPLRPSVANSGSHWPDYP